MSVPDWYATALLTLAAFSTWKVIGDDVVTERPRGWLVARVGDKFDYWITCPWCAGAYCALAWWGAWQLWPHGTLVAAALAAIRALVGLTARLLDT